MRDMPGPGLSTEALKQAEKDQLAIFEAVFWRNMQTLQAGCSGAILQGSPSVSRKIPPEAEGSIQRKDTK